MKRLLLMCAMLATLGLAGCAEEDWGLDQHGVPVTAAELDGQWLLVNYWAEWCGPCRTEIPELNALAASEGDLVVLGVNHDGLQGAELAEASTDLGIDFRVLADDPAERLEVPRSPVLPVTYLVDPRGRVRHKLVGEQTAEGLREHLAKLGYE